MGLFRDVGSDSGRLSCLWLFLTPDVDEDALLLTAVDVDAALVADSVCLLSDRDVDSSFISLASAAL